MMMKKIKFVQHVEISFVLTMLLVVVVNISFALIVVKGARQKKVNIGSVSVA